MRILLINYHCRRKTTWYRPGCFSRELARRGHEVTVVCTSDTARTGIVRTCEEGVNWVHMPDLFSGKLRTGWDPWNLLNRRRWLKDRGFDLIHAFETRPATIHPVLYCLSERPAPLVIDWIDWWGRGGLIREHRPFMYRLLLAWLETFYEEHFRTRADATTVVSRALAERAERLGVPADSVFRIPNGSPVDIVMPVDPSTHRKEFGLPLDMKIVADSGLDVMLGIETSFNAVRQASEVDNRLLMVMCGGHRKALERLALRTGIGSRFRHFGELPFDAMVRLMSCADVFLMGYPDRIANRGRWPGRMGIYMALGRPVVSNPVGEMKWLFDDYDLGLSAAETPGDMCAAILRLLGNPDMRRHLGVNARSAAEQLSWAKMTDTLEDCYRWAVVRWSRRMGGIGRNES